MKRLVGGLLAAAAALAAPQVMGQSESYGDWQVALLSKEAYIASTKNNAGSALGSICDQSGCYSFFNPAIACDHGHSYPALISTPAGAFSVDLKCVHSGDLQLYAIPLNSMMEEAMSIGGVLGIAFPMQSGEFKVARFSLTGAARASARAMQLAQAPSPGRPRQASDNSTL